MYDLHCHILPAIDDGARDLETAIQMARVAADDGITHLACTPHIYPGLFENTHEGIKQAVADFSAKLAEAGVSLNLSYGADIQVQPELLSGLREGKLPTVNQSRYFLFEPPHHVPLPHFKQQVFDVLTAGFVPIITHPERLSWIEDHYDEFLDVAKSGAWMQLTAGSLTGRFGSNPQYWSERMLEDGIVHMLATDGHNLRSRPPLLAEGAEAAVKFVGKEEADRLVMERPRAVWNDVDPATIPKPPGFDAEGNYQGPQKKGFWKKLFG